MDVSFKVFTFVSANHVYLASVPFGKTRKTYQVRSALKFSSTYGLEEQKRQQLKRNTAEQ